MRRFSRIKSSEIGHTPGDLHGVEENGNSEIELIRYNSDNYERRKIEEISEEFLNNNDYVSWINITGIRDVEVIKKVGKLLDLHPLTLEDITNTRQRPKKEEFENYLITIIDILSYNGDYIQSEQVSLILTENAVITFQEAEGDDFDPIRRRLEEAKGQIRKKGADYLLYSLLDAVVDNYFKILEKTEEQLEEIDKSVVSEKAGPETLELIQSLKQEIIFLRKNIWPLNSVFSSLYRIDFNLFNKETDYYLRDVYDHIVQLMDEIEVIREMLSSMLDVYLSNKSNKMNEVMKVLTIIATIFIPLTFVAGIYGMNFQYMPELDNKLAYPAVMIFMLIIAVLQLIYFRWKKWF
jgi:magnesium transporter